MEVVKVSRKDIIKDSVVKYEMLDQLFLNIKLAQAYDKVSNFYYQIERMRYFDYEIGVKAVEFFLNELELLPVTSASIGYVISKKLSFSGIKYSQATDIFYKVVDEKLFKFPAYKRNLNATASDSGNIGDEILYTNQSMSWEPSDFSNINNTADYWLDVTKMQISKFNLGVA